MAIPAIARLALAAALIAAPAFAQDHPGEAAGAKPDAQAGQHAGPSGSVLGLLPGDSATEHAVTLRGGARIAYTATAGTLDIFGQNGQRLAKIFYTSYTAKNQNGARRPVTFAFNGGPGAASAYLHIGMAGPRIADFGDGHHNGADARLVDNPDTWLAFTDLVFIDPVGTGWSRTAKPDDAHNFYNVRADAQLIAKVIALYVAKYDRMPSPKYLLGESYGGFRAVEVARSLQHDQGIVASGIVAMSPLLEGGLEFGASRFALGAALQFPSLAAAELERNHAYTPQALADAEHFALTDYLTTLAGPPPQGAAAAAFYAKVAGMTGLPAEIVARNRGFIRDAYVKHLRNAKVVSPYDVNFAVPDPYPESADAHNDDPVLDGFTRALGGLFVSYARQELGFKCDMTYELLAGDIARKWDWKGAGGSQSRASVVDDIREFAALNPTFRMMIAHGTSDLVTPYAVSRYVVDHLPPSGAPNRVELKLYRGGHMFYFTSGSRQAFTADARAFYTAPAE